MLVMKRFVVTLLILLGIIALLSSCSGSGTTAKTALPGDINKILANGRATFVEFYSDT